MRQVRRSVVGLLVGLAVFANLDRLDTGAAHGVPLIWIVGLVAVLSLLTVSLFQRLSVYLSLGFWLAVYAVVKSAVLREPLLGGAATYASIAEAALLVAVVWVAHQLAGRLTEFERAVEDLTLANVWGRVRRWGEATEEIALELARSRRHQRPLSVVVVEPDPSVLHAGHDALPALDPTLAERSTKLPRLARPASVYRIVQEVQRSALDWCVLAGLVRAIGGELRRTDLVLVGADLVSARGDRGRLVVLSPETDATGAATLAERIRAIAAEQFGLAVACGTASFPDEALTFEELVAAAEARAARAAEPRRFAPSLPKAELGR